MIEHVSSRKRIFKWVTITLAADSKMPVIDGQWKRLPNGLIRAWYTPEEYERCQKVAERVQTSNQEPI